MFRRMSRVAVIVAVVWIAAACSEQRPVDQERDNEVGSRAVSAVNVSGQVPDDLRRAMDERAEAIFGVNPDVWARLTADDFTVVQSDGRLMNKAERLAELRTQTPASVPAVEQAHIQNYGDIVVHRFRSEDDWVFEVWVHGQRGWQVSITQLTPARP